MLCDVCSLRFVNSCLLIVVFTLFVCCLLSSFFVCDACCYVDVDCVVFFFVSFTVCFDVGCFCCLLSIFWHSCYLYFVSSRLCLCLSRCVLSCLVSVFFDDLSVS